MSTILARYINIESIYAEISNLDLDEGQRVHLVKLIDSSLHHAILDEILSNLDSEDKNKFLKMLAEDPKNEKIVNFLNEKIENIEERIKKVADDLSEEMKKDIEEAKSK